METIKFKLFYIIPTQEFNKCLWPLSKQEPEIDEGCTMNSLKHFTYLLFHSTFITLHIFLHNKRFTFSYFAKK